jgi:hypothetical protein
MGSENRNEEGNPIDGHAGMDRAGCTHVIN